MKAEAAEQNNRLQEFGELQCDSEKTVERMASQIEQLKALNSEAVAKCEDLKAQISKLQKQHSQELKDKVSKASKRSEDVEAEI